MLPTQMLAHTRCDLSLSGSDLANTRADKIPSHRQLRWPPSPRPPMDLQVVHDDDITAMQRRSQTLFDIGQEPRSVHCSIDHEGCNHSVVTQAGYQSDGLPMPLWDV